MNIAIKEESHNRVVWEMRTPLLRIELGLLVGGALLILVLMMGTGPRRWALVALTAGLTLSCGGLLALITPLTERGEMERTPEGGGIYRARRWLLFGRRVIWEAPLELVSGFRLESRAFEESGGQSYALARLWTVLAEGETVLLTQWAEPASAEVLGQSLAKAGRRTYEA